MSRRNTSVRCAGSALALAAALWAVQARAADAPAAGTPDDVRCVVGVEPDVKSVTFVSPSRGPEGGALSVFLSETPKVAVGDLVRIVRKPGQSSPTLETVEAGSARCQELAKGASTHHGKH